MSNLTPFLTTAIEAADQAGALVRRYFHQPVRRERKLAASPIVTEADREAEKLIRQIIERAHPAHAIFGEEYGFQPGKGSYEWILDPIDGTIAFSCGKPVFATLIALVRDGTPVIGIIDQPVTGHRWIGVAGQQTTLNGSPCAVAAPSSLEDARFSTTAPEMFAGDLEPAFGQIRERCWITSYGGDAYAYGLFASGHLDLILECGLKRHDIAALLPVVEGAGGILTDFSGDKHGILAGHEQDADYEALAVTSASLAEEILAILNGGSPSGK